jgi:site-specific DNA-methyltransferase (adenine-specific)
MIDLILDDCMNVMKKYEDNHFDLAIVDPPYGGAGDDKLEKGGRFGGIFDKYKVSRTGGGYAKKYGKKIIDWDLAPPKEYFDELFRVSKNQIIWGGNYFGLPPNRCFLIWRKLTISESFTMAMCEYAWCSFNSNSKWIEIAPQGKNRFHPTQKPVKLYDWILTNYAEKGQKILDTHLGSGSIGIACHNFGVDLVGIEIDSEYYQKAKNRIDKETRQESLF